MSSRLKRFAPAAAYLGLSAVFWLAALRGRRALFYDVLFYLTYPNTAFLRASLSRGLLPLWNPHLYSGTPFLADIQTAVFYPATWLYALMPFARALALAVWLHAALAGLAMHLLARKLGFSHEGACAAGLAYGFNGFFVSHYAYPEVFSTYPWLPVILWLLLRALDGGSRRDALAAGGAAALAVCAGHPQFALYTGAGAAAFFLLERPSTRAAGILALAGLFAAGACAVQWLPFFAFLRHCSRLASPSYDFSTLYSVKPADLARMLAQPLWNRSFSPSSGDSHVVGFYFGLPLLFLALWGLFAGRRARAFAWLAAAGIALSLGRFLPLYPALYAWVAPIRWLRFPAQALFLACFGLAGLAGLGLDRLGWPAAASWGLLALAAADLLLFAGRAVQTIDPAFYAARLSTPAYLRRAAGEDYRIMMTPRTRQAGRRAGRNRLDAWLGFRDSLYPNLAEAEGLRDADGRLELRDAAYDGVLSALSRSPRSPWLDALSIRYLLTFWDLPASKFRLARAGPIKVYENESALPRAYFCPAAVHVPPGGETAYVQAHPGFDFRRALLWSGPQSPGRSRGRARLLSGSPNALSAEVAASGPGWLVVTDAYDPGWTARVDGGPQPLARVNAVQRAVAVGAGNHLVEMRYEPPFFRAGAAVSLLTLAGGLLWAL